jgi:hypothetical protein
LQIITRCQVLVPLRDCDMLVHCFKLIKKIIQRKIIVIYNVTTKII